MDDKEIEEEIEEIKKENSILKIFIFIIALIIVGLCGYFIGSSIFDNKNKTKYVSTEYELADPNKAIVYKNYDESTKNIKVPYVNIDSKNALEINKKIKEFTKKIKEDPVESNGDYEYYFDGTVLSLVYKYNLNASDDYETYNLNVKTDKILTTTELINYVNNEVTEDNFKERILEVFYKKVSESEEEYNMIPPSIREKGETTSVKDATINDINEKNIDDYEIYINKNKEIIVINDEYNIAGPEGNRYRINLNKLEYVRR